jgi:NADH:ubiquinone oxidoreductase subunit F (NADH-binding)/NADH:ubiquinone oxidoreductase subunit E
VFSDVTERTAHLIDLERRYGREAERPLECLRAAKAGHGGLTADVVDQVAGDLGLPPAHVHGAASFYADLGFAPVGARRVRACAGTACFVATRAAGEVAGAERVHCLGYCYAAPAALDGDAARAGPDLAGQLAGEVPAVDPAIPHVAAVRDPVLLGALTGGDPLPWHTWPEVLAGGGSGRVLAEVERSGLCGRGGAAFPVARKWRAAAARPGPRYVVGNGDEGDPGSFADRLLMESAPDRVLEGMALAALASGADRAIAYVRSEYPRARDALREAAARARAAGHLGHDVHGAGIDLEIEVVEGAGSYVAGEETALLRSVEGVRGSVAVRPPFPTDAGLYRRPTVVNNVETLATVPWIVARGGAAYAALGTDQSRGTKLVCLNERFRRPGVYEVELGVPIRWICDQLGGGLREGLVLRALQVGGPLGGFLGPDELDLPFSIEATRAAGVELGHGGLVAIDDGVPAAELLTHLWEFAASESCGGCSPCRVGTRRGLELARRIGASDGAGEALEAMRRVLDVMGTASLCGFGLGAAPALRSLLRVYAPELEALG